MVFWKHIEDFILNIYYIISNLELNYFILFHFNYFTYFFINIIKILIFTKRVFKFSLI